MTPEWKAELDRRTQEYLKNPSKGRSWEQVSKAMKAKIREINANRTNSNSTPKRKKT